MKTINKSMALWMKVISFKLYTLRKSLLFISFQIIKIIVSLEIDVYLKDISIVRAKSFYEVPSLGAKCGKCGGSGSKS